jgi:hyperosmotically inducible periplasmic protein
MRITEDDNLFKKIKQRILWDIRVSNQDVSLKVRHGQVILYGYFDKSYRHEAVVSLINSTDGVKQFIDNSQVLRDYYRTDKEIEKLLAKQILNLPLLENEWINIHVKRGVVQLHGQVTKPELKAFAARTSWELSGVQDCQNLIQLCKPTNPELRLYPTPFQFEYLNDRTLLL